MYSAASSSRVLCALIFVLALLLRFVHLFQIYQTPLLSVDYVPDTLPFLIIAQKIIEGNFFYVIPMNMNVLYSFYLIPFILLFQESVLAAVVVQLFIDALSALLVYLIGRRIFDVRTGLLAAFIYAVYAPLIWFAGMPVGESVSIFLLLLSFTFLIKAIRFSGPGRLLLSGGNYRRSGQSGATEYHPLLGPDHQRDCIL